MNLIIWLYLVDVAGSLRVYFGFGIIIAVIVVLSTLIAGIDHRSDDVRFWRDWSRWLYCSMIAFILNTLIFLALPTTQTLYLMIGAKTAQEIVVNPAVQKIGARVMNIIDKKLDALAGEATEKKTKQ